MFIRKWIIARLEIFYIFLLDNALKFTLWISKKPLKYLSINRNRTSYYFVLMKSFIAVISLLLCAVLKLHAQQPVDDLISAEKKFASISKEQSTRTAFLSSIDSNCVGFREGNLINAFTEWSNRPEATYKLTWQPEYAVIASSGEIGFTTGPWELRPSSLNDTPVARGHYTTIWKKAFSGKWKAVCDIGTSYNTAYVPAKDVKSKTLSHSNTPLLDSVAAMAVETSFISRLEKDNISAYADCVTTDTWFNINEHQPARNPQAIEQAIHQIPSDIKFAPSGIWISSSNDMICVYGIATSGKQKTGYQRVWGLQNGQWKLLIQVM